MKFQSMKPSLILLLFLIVGTSACKQSYLKKYYFNFEKFSKGKIYKFVDQNNPENISYWHMKYQYVDGYNLFFTYGLDERLRTSDVFIEKIKKDKSGSMLFNSYVIQYDSLEIPTKKESYTLKNDVYSFKESDYPIEWSVRESDKFGFYEFIRKRNFLNKNIKQTISNITYDCILDHDEYIVKYPDSETFPVYTRDTYYAKNLGVVRYIEKFRSDSTIQDYHLVEILDEKFIEDNYSKLQD